MNRCIKILAGLVLVSVFPLQVYAQFNTCNGQVGGGSLTPSPYFDGTQQTTGDVIRYDAKIGATDISGGTQMSISEFDYYIDCGQSDTFPGCTPPGTNTIAYLGNVSTDCKTALTQGVDVVWSDTYTASSSKIEFTAVGPPAVVAPQSTCNISFDIRLDTVGSAPSAGFGGQKPVYQLGGFTPANGACDNGLTGGGQGSASFGVAECAITLEKDVSVTGSGGPWIPADSSPGPNLVVGGDAYFQLEACNTGSAPFVNPPGLAIKDPNLLIDTTLAQTLDPGQCAIVESGQIGSLFQPGYCKSAGAIKNTSEAVGSCRAGTDPISVNDNNDAWVNCIAPALKVTKTGPAKSKVGETVTYEVCAENTGGVELQSCTGTDNVVTTWTGDYGTLAVGAPEKCIKFDYKIPAGSPDPLKNTATVQCNVVGSSTPINNSDDHTVELFQPAISATKKGPSEGKVGDKFNYEICVKNDSSADTPALINCSADDTLLGVLPFPTAPALGATECITPEYTIPATAPAKLRNDVKVTCDVTGFPNKPSADAFHELDVFKVDYALTKECDPKDIPVPDPITWTICVENTGDKAIDCTINDPDAGIVDGKVTVSPAGKDCSTTATRLTTSADVPEITNKATAACTVPGYTNQLPDKEATDTCKVGEILELCRTPGFWKTHAGEEKGGKAHNLAQIVIDSTTNDTLGTICGVEIDNTSVNGYSGAGSYPGDGSNSAVEGMCVHIKTKIVRQLQRQLIAASLNCVVSGGSADCTGVSVGDDWKAANADCATVANGGSVAGGLSPWIEIIDDFNNGEPPFKCTENIEDSPVFDGLNRVPGPAGSSNACNEATYNDFYLVPLTP